MGFLETNISLPTALSLFCLPKKVTNPVSLREPNASARNRPSLGKEALFYWLVLRTAPYELIINILKFCNPIIHVKFKLRVRI